MPHVASFLFGLLPQEDLITVLLSSDCVRSTELILFQMKEFTAAKILGGQLKCVSPQLKDGVISGQKKPHYCWCSGVLQGAHQHLLLSFPSWLLSIQMKSLWLFYVCASRRMCEHAVGRLTESSFIVQCVLVFVLYKGIEYNLL